MSHNIFYYDQTSASGSAQINQGPFHLGTVNRLLQIEAVGTLNYQSQTLSVPTVLTNNILWGVSLVPHGSAVLDVLVSLDNDQWPIRQMIDFGSYVSWWAPSSAVGVAMVGAALNKLWRGQLILLADTDMYLSWGLPFGGSFADFNAVGSLRAWWS
jgi:hypothetical protein